MDFSELLVRVLNAKIDIGPGILWREIIGNGFGLASVIFGMRRRIAAWPVGIMGNVILFTVFLGGVFNTPQDLNLVGQAGRQVFFVITSIYGWVQWHRVRRAGGGELDSKAAVNPRWARPGERLQLVIAAAALTVVFYLALRALGSWGPAADAWILTGSILATYGMARGWIEFWLLWVLVDAVGVPLLVSSGNYPSALMYLCYAAMCVVGLVSWVRLRRRMADHLRTQDRAAEPATRLAE